MPAEIVAQVVGFPGCGKTTLIEKCRKSCNSSKFVFKDTDDFLPDMAGLHEWIQEQKVPIVMMGTFGIKPVMWKLPNAQHYLWMDVSLEESTDRAMIRQFLAMGENPQKTLAILKEKNSAEQASRWLNDFVNPHLRKQRWQGMREMYVGVIGGFRALSADDIYDLLFEE